jgi:molybdopterin-guanine dinucleotide biosynthesis protein A
VHARNTTQAEIAVASSGGQTHPTIALWPVSLRDGLRRALVNEDMRRITAFLARYTIAQAEWPITPRDPFFNVNTAGDLAEAERLARSR